MLEYIKNLQKKEIEVTLEKALFIFSLFPLLLNWIVGLYFLKDEHKKIYIYRNFIVSFVFLILSSFLYLIYAFFINFISIVLLNPIFFMFQLFFTLGYIYISITQILSYYQGQDYWILRKIDKLYIIILEYL